ncbi:MAG: hypothetical protein R3336_00395 [Phycisphaeraceae bacterium]|nr:hypothetical protein [Phycisphaeraceae bacterium]
MLELFKTLVDFSELVDIGYDVPVYATLAMAGTLLFIIRTGLTLFFGLDDFDFDVDLEDHGGEFGVLSIMSITAFLMGAGWVGFFARTAWGMEPLGAGFAAGGTGAGFMLATAAAMFGMKRLGHEVTYDLKTAVGETGQVYMTIPERGGGRGQVRVSVSGRSMIVDAVSHAGKVEAFTDVRIEEALDRKTVRVEPLHPADTPEVSPGVSGDDAENTDKSSESESDETPPDTDAGEK